MVGNNDTNNEDMYVQIVHKQEVPRAELKENDKTNQVKDYENLDEKEGVVREEVQNKETIKETDDSMVDEKEVIPRGDITEESGIEATIEENEEEDEENSEEDEEYEEEDEDSEEDDAQVQLMKVLRDKLIASGKSGTQKEVLELLQKQLNLISQYSGAISLQGKYLSKVSV
ncbi:nucleolar protein 12-like isoform X4 [Diaphorina citri]|uniref:Nucleolar protein 12-like isoform X4 n=1 Tax=Diaphorina citri TaxID=121845 RepID=A0A1S3CZC4_DIACI|nr:nucleolar protein 12-like isoform X4 [Diaphorina citri]